MSGGDQLSESEPTVVCVFVGESPSTIVGEMVRKIMDACIADPHGFVDEEQAASNRRHQP